MIVSEFFEKLRESSAISILANCIMPENRIENTQLWKRTLSQQGEDVKDVYIQERERLRAAFWEFRKNAAHLTSQVAKNFPDLTLHDISHLDALWETADLLIGEKFPINPLEAFVLGGTIFLHDAALTFEAYQGGQSAVRATSEWKDAFAVLEAQHTRISEEELQKSADFDAIRYLHASQAEKLVEHSWQAKNQDPRYLLQDASLRQDLGHLMGQIAASHHWDIDKVASGFNRQENAPSGFPREWAINPIKIACILRCADAVNFDNRRAPDFLYALLKRNHVSESHWKAQNMIPPATYDEADPTTLLFTSTRGFTEEDANAWYVAYDALCIAHKEIQTSNACLEQSGSSALRAKHIKGVESPEIMAKYIKPKGWKPTAAKIHISNIEDMIRKLGGEQLYGTDADKLEIALRELIQNARDAVVARRCLDKNFEGKIVVSISKDDNEPSTFWLTVEDDGIGMSERVLTDTLLDFGTSFWASSLIQSEFPGLRSSGFQSVGKFGIGFFSVFMIAEQVYVESRNWKKGFDDIHQVKFTNGLSLKPIICKGEPDGFRSSVSTRIRLKLKQDIIPENFMIEIKVNQAGAKNFFVPLQNYIAAICAGLDVVVIFRGVDKNEEKIHESINPNNLDTSKLLRDISFAQYQDRKEYFEEIIVQNHKRLKPIFESERLLGLAAIPIGIKHYLSEFLSISTSGGLAFSTHLWSRHSDHIIGFLDHKPKSAKREMGDYAASQKIIQQWANEQMNELLTLNLDPLARYSAASSLCHFQIDPTPLASIFIKQGGAMRHLSVSEVAELSMETGIAFLFSELIPEHISEILFVQQESFLKDVPQVTALFNSSFLSLKRTDEGIPENNFSMLDCIYRMAISKGYGVKLEIEENIGQDKFRFPVHALILKSKRP